MRTREDRARLDNFFTGVGRKPFLVPLWHEQYRTTAAFGLSTTGVSLPAGTAVNREFRVGTLVFITTGDSNVYETAEIVELDVETGDITFAEALTKSWPSGRA